MTNLLVIDRSADRRARVRELATRAGFTVCEADSAAIGLVLWREASPGVVLIALDAADDAGITALRLLESESRSDPARRAALWTFGDARFDDAARALGMGAELALGPLGDGRELATALDESLRPRRRVVTSIGSLP